MAIHHAQHRQAEQYGFTLDERAPHVRAFHPSTGTQVFGASAKDAINQMLAFLNIYKLDPDVRFKTGDEYLDNVRIGRLHNAQSGMISISVGTPVELFRDFKTLTWADPDADFEPDAEKPVVDDTPLIKRAENGVPLDGAVAYKEGVMAADNPFAEGSEEADEWDAQWDQSADESADAEEDSKGGSVVSPKYRHKYAELGHPTHCGDWLANLLNNFCVGSKATDLETFEKICALNGVDTSKYNRTSPGWQGRLRMTGRNLLARKVYDAKQIKVPNSEVEDGVQIITAPADWIAVQRFKGKTE